MTALALKADFLQAVDDMARAEQTTRARMLETIIREAAAVRRVALAEYERAVCRTRFDSGTRDRRPRSGVAVLSASELCHLEWGWRCARRAKQKEREEAGRRVGRARCRDREPIGRDEASQKGRERGTP